MKFDRDIDKHDILELSTSDAITAFFADLGYNTDARTEQTPGNLGITAEGVLRQINRIELIADQDGLLQVYLFEMKSVTVTVTRGLARSFRNRTGNYLLVLTDDFEQVDFVLIEKYLPQKKPTTKLVGQPHVGVRPRSLTVNRRKPDAVHLRVLRRFTYTESDPISQYDKLVSAYAIANWSEQFFNNRALFSDHYLMNRVPDLPEWKHDSKPAYRKLHELYKDVASQVVGKGESVLHDNLVLPSLNALGFKVEKAGKSKSDKPGPDYTLYTQKTHHTQLSMCLVYPWMRYLDGKDYKRDLERKDENPGQKVVSLLEAENAPDWAIVTNGKIWRLYSKRTHAKATNYYEIDLEEILSQGGQHAGGPGDAFRYFWLIFRSEAFILESSNVEGEERQLSFLDRLLTESDTYAKELGERLKERVFEDVFPLLAKGFIAYIRDRDGINTDLSQDALDEVFLGTLTLLYRILFLLYAEARDLLPVKEVRGYYVGSQRKLTEEIAKAAGDLQDESYGKLKKAYYADDYKLYDRLQDLFKVIDLGDETRNVPVYNGGLFITDPPDDDDSADVRNARFLSVSKVPDRHLAQALDLLARDLDPKRHDLVFVDYKSLGVRQLGSIYEGLLEFKLRIAPGKMAIVKGKKTEEVIPYSEAVKKKRKILTIGRGKSAKERVYKKGDIYLENDKKERKASGSYYTPDHIVKYIVEHTVGPVLEEKFEAMRPKLREAQMRYKAWQDRQKAMKVPNPESQADSIAAELADELFDIKVLDPAMGSGHFLVEAVDFITDKALDFLNAFPWNPVIAKLERTRHEILDEMENQGITVDQNRLTDVNLLKRHVLKRCIYGVDLNPMAVELAKVSLWLDCFTLGAPLSFLDHHMKAGNSLIGVTIEDVDDAITGGGKGGTELGLFSKPMQSLKASLKTMLEIGDLPDVTPAQVRNSRNLYESALAKTQPVKRLLDVYTSRWFGNTPSKSSGRGKKKTKARDIPLEFLNSEESTAYRDAIDDKALIKAASKLPVEFREMVETAEQDSDEKRFFHWEMEFPEVFYKPREDAPEHVERMDGAGFDAVIGNPPYVRQEGLGDDKPFFESEHAPVFASIADIYVYFYHRGLNLCRDGGFFGMITSNKFLRAGYGKNLRRFLTQFTITGIIDFGDLPIFPDAISYPMIFVTRREAPAIEHVFRALTVANMAQANQIGPVMESQPPATPLTALNENTWVLERPEVLELLEKIRTAGRPLSEVIHGKFYRGILTGYNEAFVIDEAKRQELINADPKSEEIIKPLLRGRDIKRWRVEWSGLYLIKTEIGVDIKRYPAIFAHLKRYQPQLEKRSDQGKYWWELRACVYYDEFEKPKIVWPEIFKRARFAFDRDGFYANKTTFIIPTEDFALLAILNSSLIHFWCIHSLPKLQHGYLLPSAIFLKDYPIVNVPQSVRKTIEAHVRSLLDDKTDGIDALEHEQEIDRIVNELYGLSNTEIEIMEASVQ